MKRLLTRRAYPTALLCWSIANGWMAGNFWGWFIHRLHAGPGVSVLVLTCYAVVISWPDQDDDGPQGRSIRFASTAPYRPLWERATAVGLP